MPPVPVVEPTGRSLAGFLDALRKSRLVDAAELEDRLAVAPSSIRNDSQRFADYLVRTRVLTQFQAEKLVLGYWQGLCIRDYRLLYPIGRGGMGIVYLAAEGERNTGSPIVALKVIPPQRAKKEPRMLIRFRREMEIGLGLPVSPFLARTLAGGEADGVHFLAMEFVAGRTVKELLTGSGPMALGSACRVFADVARGLEAAHGAGYVHRDLKPSNVVVSGAGRGKLLDFGFAYRIGEPTPADPAILGGPGHTVGTMDYLAPEQARDAANVGPAADIYSLGCSLYYAVTGTPPFPGGTPQDKIRWHRTAHPESVTQFNPTLPVEFDQLIQSLMGKRVKERPATAAEVAAHLEYWAESTSELPRETEAKPDELIRIVENRWLQHNNRLETDGDDTGPIILESSEYSTASPSIPLARRIDTEPSGIVATPQVSWRFWWIVQVLIGLVITVMLAALVVRLID